MRPPRGRGGGGFRGRGDGGRGRGRGGGGRGSDRGGSAMKSRGRLVFDCFCFLIVRWNKKILQL
ncbi:hypothetical protein ES288_A12G077200v1 [Gossypium darwinii]|uniref:Uncharacterized protein n=1 Tax=Gossypium darwinii TaxID=34276 RepID=A0A5D2E6T4_GOSDA|nr:hypothetical protein ES288_A12G077200v1 [Gossypium darwinii]